MHELTAVMHTSKYCLSDIPIIPTISSLSIDEAYGWIINKKLQTSTNDINAKYMAESIDVELFFRK